MKTIATPEKYLAARKAIEDRGETVTVERLKTELGGGSPNTFQALKKQHGGQADGDDSREDLAALQSLARNIRARGRNDCQPEIDSLNQEKNMAFLQRDAAQLKAQEFEGKYMETLARAAELQEKLSRA